MKKMLILLSTSLIFLSGCSMPFSSSDKELDVSFLEGGASSIAASNEIDKLLVEELKAAEGNLVPFSQLINEVRHARGVQGNLYSELKKDGSGVTLETKKVYLNILTQRISSYDALINNIAKENYDSLSKAVKLHEVRNESLEKKTLANTNKLLEELGGKKLKEFKK